MVINARWYCYGGLHVLFLATLPQRRQTFSLMVLLKLYPACQLGSSLGIDNGKCTISQIKHRLLIQLRIMHSADFPCVHMAMMVKLNDMHRDQGLSMGQGLFPLLYTCNWTSFCFCVMLTSMILWGNSIFHKYSMSINKTQYMTNITWEQKKTVQSHIYRILPNKSLGNHFLNLAGGWWREILEWRNY